MPWRNATPPTPSSLCWSCPASRLGIAFSFLHGCIALLTNQPDLVRSPAFHCLQRLEITLFGQTPTILVLETSGFIKNRRQ